VQQPSPLSFTTKAADNGLLNVLRNDCHVSKAWDPNGDELPPAMEQFTAVWDTGATNSMITQAVVDKCGLVPISTTTIAHALGTTSDVEVFLVNIRLPNKVGFPGLRVAKAVLSQGDVLIGMDIINQGDFAVTNVGGSTKFSFRIPSQADIDFVAEDNVLLTQSTPSRAERRRKQKEDRRRGIG
jgi:predicted aspartyl protease